MRNWFQISKRHPAQWPLEMQLGMLSPTDPWRLSDAVTGTMILGDSGSGKTSGGYKYVLECFLRAGMGGLLLVVKNSDLSDLERLARQYGRSNDLVIFGADQPHKFNLLDFELKQGGGSKASRLENVVQLFKVILEIAERDRHSGNGSGENKYFERAALQMLRSALLALIVAEEPITLENIHRFIMSAPRSLDESRDLTWRERSYCYLTLCKADDQPQSESLTKDFELTLLYWMQEFPGMDVKPRSSIVSTYTTMADPLQRGVLRDLFFGETTITPDACRDGKIFVLDFPTLRWNEVGRIIQATFKYVWQRIQERFDVTANPRPVFLASDEAQQFLISCDSPFQATARSSRVCTLYASQNLPGMYEAVGGEAGRHVIDGLLGNLRLKLFFSQTDTVTCQWQSELCGKTKRLLFNSSSQTPAEPSFELFRPRRQQQSGGFSESWEYEIQPWEWSRHFRSGGARHNYQVDGVAFQGGSIWNANGKSYLPVTFSQR